MTVTAQSGSFPTNQDLDPVRLREAFGTFPSGVVAVAATVAGVPTGLAASSFTSVSLEPPLVSFSVANSSATWPALRRAGHLGVTVLADHHGEACRQLAGPAGQRFEGLAWTSHDDGALTLDDGLARFDCTIYREVEAGDHTLVLLALHGYDHAPVDGDQPAHEQAGPLVFHRSGFGSVSAHEG